MRSIFRPAILIMNRLYYPQKFLLVGLLLLLPLLLVMTQYIRQVNDVTDFASKEQLGLIYNTPVTQFLQDVQRHRSLVSAALSGSAAFKDSLAANEVQIDTDIEAVDAVDVRLGGTLHTTPSWTAIKARWDQLKKQYATMGVDASFNAHSLLDNALLVFITEVGNNSNLILDPDIDSYYVMDSMITRLPAIAEYAAQLRDYGLINVINKTLAPEDRTRFTIYVNLARSTYSSSLLSYSYAFGVNDGLQNRLQGPLAVFNSSLNKLLATIDGTFVNILDFKVNVQPLDFYTTSTQAVDSVFALYNQSSPELNQLLQARIDRNAAERNLVIVFALLALALTVYLFIAFYLSVRQAISSLDQASQRMIKGDSKTAFALESHDELAQVAVSFNSIALEMLAARDQALELNRVKSAFLASMSHELRTPLNAVINFTLFVANGDLGEVNADQAQMLGEVVDSGKHLLNLINDVLDMSKIEAGSLNLFVEDDVNLKSALASVGPIARTLIGDRPVALNIDISDDLPLMRIDRQRILQIVLNIVSNACKFTKTGSIDLRAVQKGDDILIAVKDTGPGIAREDHALVFEAFKQTDAGLRQGGGTGLGMPISKSLAEAHGGRLWLESEPGKGAAFFVSIPIKSAKLVPMFSAMEQVT